MKPDDEETILGEGDEENGKSDAEETLLGSEDFSEETLIGQETGPREPLLEENIPPIEGVRCERYLGQGAAGAVFLVRQEKLSRYSALKLLHEDLGKDRGFRRRFHREGQILAQMDHPNIVRVYDVGEAQGHYYLLLEFVDGGNLQDHLQLSGGNLEAEEVRQILKEVLEALAYAHRSQIVHCDLKPMNLLRTGGGRTKISDFGIAKVMGTRRFVDTHATREGQTAVDAGEGEGTVIAAEATKDKSSASPQGTLDYMAPEVRAGQNPSARSDLFAVGVIAYYLLTGKKPYGKYRPASKLARGVHRRWDTFIDQCLVNDPTERMPSARRALQALEAIPMTGRPSRGRLAFLTLLLLAVFSAYAWVQELVPGLRPDPAPPSEPSPAIAQPARDPAATRKITEPKTEASGQTAGEALAVGDLLIDYLPRRRLDPGFSLLDESGVTARRTFAADDPFGLRIKVDEEMYMILLTYLGDRVHLAYPEPGGEPHFLRAFDRISTDPVPAMPPYGSERLQLVTATLPGILEDVIGFFGAEKDISARTFRQRLLIKGKDWGNPGPYGQPRTGAADLFLFVQPPTSTDPTSSP